MHIRPAALHTLCFCMLWLLTAVSCAKKDTDTQTTDAPTPPGTLTGIVVDSADGMPVAVRVYITGPDDSVYVAGDGITYEQPRFRERIGYTGRHFTTVGDSFTVRLPAGVFTVRIERGKEYTPVEETVEIAGGAAVTRRFVIGRWIDMASMGWYSGDLHVHRSLPDMESLMRAEDLNVASVQTVWGLKRDPDLDTWLRKAGPDGCVRVDDTCLFSVLSHEIERTRNSALLLHRTGTTILPVADYEERELSNARLADFARRHGSIIEAEKPWWPESHIDIAVCGARLTGVANNHFTYRGYLPEHARKRTEFRDDYPDGAEGYAAYTLDLYYAYLDCGFKVSPTAGSASGVLPNPLGYNRVYVHVDGPLTFDSWMTALGEGRCFVTNGPMLFLAAGDGGPGDTVTVTESSMSVACEVHSPVPIDRLEIVRDGGEIIHTVSPVLTDGKATVIANIPVVKSGWIAARCFEKRDDTVRFAQTAPVYVDVPGKPFKPKRYAADYFLRKTNDLVVRAETGDYPTDEARDSAMDAYQAAKSVFERLLAESE